MHTKTTTNEPTKTMKNRRLAFMFLLFLRSQLWLLRKELLKLPKIQTNFHLSLLSNGVQIEKKTQIMHAIDAITNNPPIHSNGTLVFAKNMSPFEEVKPFNQKTDKETRGWDNEGYDAITDFFWGRCKGLVLELGALDGRRFSVSADFLPFEWHRILVEASPRYANNGPNISPDSTYVHGAVCKSDGLVHYVSDLRPHSDGAINGIGEFMSHSFLKEFHPLVFEASLSGTNFTAVADWTRWSEKNPQSKVEEVPCVDLTALFNALQIDHVNFLMLDVEGGEFGVLQTIDWNRIMFDVIAVETEPFQKRLRPPNYAKNIMNFLRNKNYIFERNRGRNSWFRHHDFQASSKPP